MPSSVPLIEVSDNADAHGIRSPYCKQGSLRPVLLQNMCTELLIRRIMTLVYSEHDNPHEILGAHATERGILIGAYVPEAQEITVITEKGGEYQKAQIYRNPRAGASDAFFRPTD